MIRRPTWTVLFALLVLVACRPSTPPERTTARPAPRRTTAEPRARTAPAAGVVITGTLQAAPGQTLPARARVAILWVVSFGSPDYVYAWGAGRSTGATFEVTLPGPPPAEALNSGTLGVGMVVLLPADAPAPSGRLTRAAWRTLTKTALGGAHRHGILYRIRAPTRSKPSHWIGTFPAGYRCGLGFKPDHSRFEGFRPMACTGLRIQVAPFGALRWVNWT